MVERVGLEADNCSLTNGGFGAAMSYFMSPQTHQGLLPSSQGGAVSPGSSLGLYSPIEPVVVASSGLGPLGQKAEQVAPVAQAWGLALAVPEARGCPGGASWETLQRKEYGQYNHKFPHTRQPESLGWEDGCSRSRAPHLGGPGRPGPLLLCGLSPGVLPTSSEAVGKEAGSQPDICILTLAMMIAGIPTVPVPGLREEDLIRAAQAFMMVHPESEGAMEGARREQARAHTASGQAPLMRSRRGQPPGSCL
ncbi:spermatogenesis-associated protein 25 [Callorhinus ursinus]|uniref:Spermatogenesis-associated protein 25 n=1 Tax=Callorhinus ursinus TaxID=34884 RepID=A0A3Q7PN44_CALUR|nr:spermatogenesis-associated protein 25-like [Callorhinus ursinus]XP_025731452.1 spermatogenesis-associated protein 25 [Callorhinus ursinus]